MDRRRRQWSLWTKARLTGSGPRDGCWIMPRPSGLFSLEVAHVASLWSAGAAVLGRILRHASSLSGDGGSLNFASIVKFLAMRPGGAGARGFCQLNDLRDGGFFLFFSFFFWEMYSGLRGLATGTLSCWKGYCG